VRPISLLSSCNGQFQKCFGFIEALLSAIHIRKRAQAVEGEFVLGTKLVLQNAT
jgi:hypothetical protein